MQRNGGGESLFVLHLRGWYDKRAMRAQSRGSYGRRVEIIMTGFQRVGALSVAVAFLAAAASFAQGVGGAGPPGPTHPKAPASPSPGRPSDGAPTREKEPQS